MHPTPNPKECWHYRGHDKADEAPDMVGKINICWSVSFFQNNSDDFEENKVILKPFILNSNDEMMHQMDVMDKLIHLILFLVHYYLRPIDK